VLARLSKSWRHSVHDVSSPSPLFDISCTHGSTVTAESAGEGLGATFTVRLPVHDATDRF
jgi:hypothetical protein